MSNPAKLLVTLGDALAELYHLSYHVQHTETAIIVRQESSSGEIFRLLIIGKKLERYKVTEEDGEVQTMERISYGPAEKALAMEIAGQECSVDVSDA